MADTYHFRNETYALPVNSSGHVLLKKHVDVPALIASGATGHSPLAVAGVRTALPSTGFAATDILQLWRVPAGVLLLGGGLRVTTLGTATTIDVGHASATATMAETAEHDRWLVTAVTTAVGYFNFDGYTGVSWVADQTGNEEWPLDTLSIDDLSIDVTFNSAAESTLIADFWMYGVRVH